MFKCSYRRTVFNGKVKAFVYWRKKKGNIGRTLADPYEAGTLMQLRAMKRAYWAEEQGNLWRGSTDSLKASEQN